MLEMDLEKAQVLRESLSIIDSIQTPYGNRKRWKSWKMDVFE